MLVPPKSSSAVLVMMSSKSIYNRSHTRRGKNNDFLADTPLSCPRLRRISSPSGTKFGHNKLCTLYSHMVKTRSLCITWDWIDTGLWQRDGLTDKNYDSYSTLLISSFARNDTEAVLSAKWHLISSSGFSRTRECYAV